MAARDVDASGAHHGSAQAGCIIEGPSPGPVAESKLSRGALLHSFVLVVVRSGVDFLVLTFRGYGGGQAAKLAPVATMQCRCASWG